MYLRTLYVAVLTAAAIVLPPLAADAGGEPLIGLETVIQHVNLLTS
ncbi:hypothetical protein ACBI99_31385 [Nonomuraea sp. ATR24]|nr:hypothetical protein [Nonomuraea ceibae]